MALSRSFIRLKPAFLAVFMVFSISLESISRPSKPTTNAQQTVRVVRTLPPAQYIPDHDFDTKHIALDLHFDWDHQQLIGRETLVFAPLVPGLCRIVLDIANITTKSVKLAAGPNLHFETKAEKEELFIDLDRAYQPTDELTLTIEYQTNGPQDTKRPSLLGNGLRFIKPRPGDPTRPKQVWSQGESEYNHYWFPCYDHPNDFFTSEITATVEKPLQVISNGKLIEAKDNRDNTRTFHWKIDQPHASYLTSIIVGEFTSVTSEYAGIPIQTNVYPNELAEGKVTAARLPEMVKFFSEKTGIKYPYAKYAQTTVRDFGGGMENISATTQTDNMIHDARTELDQTSDSLQSHELAHQWFGDYVTARSWADIWLNESFATYFQAMWDEYKLGRADFLYSDIKGNQDSYFNAWRQGNRRPIVTRNYTDPDAVFDTYAYPRGGAVLHMLRKNLGEDNWWRAINYYLKKYAHQPVQTEQFRIAIEESTGQSMDWFFDEWLYRMGHPIFHVTQDYDATAKSLKVVVRQDQQPDPDYAYPQVALFQTPVEIEIGTSSGTRIERVQIEPRKEQTFTFTVDTKPLLVNFDYEGTLIKELDFKKSVAELKYQVESDQDVLGRLWALNQLVDQFKLQTATDQKEAISAILAQLLNTDKFWGVRIEAASALGTVTGQTTRNALIAATKDADARVRARALTSLSKSNDAALANVYQGFLDDPSYGVIRAAALALGQTKSPTAYDPLVKLLEKPSWRDNIKASALSGLSALGDKRSIDVGLKYAAAGNYSQVRTAAVKLLAVVGKGDDRVFGPIAQTLDESYRNFDNGLSYTSAEALASLGDARGLAIFEKLTQDVSAPPQLKGMLTRFQNQLKTVSAGPQKGAPTQP